MPKRISDPKKRVKREDVAVEAGVSTATVSYVLNRTKRLSPEVEQRVLETAARLNYIPNRIAQSLARNKTNALALITADITNVYQLDVIKGLQAEALKNDYIVYIFDAFGDVSKYIKHLISTRVDGIFVSAAPDFLSDEQLCELRDADIKVLTDFSRSTYLPDVGYVRRVFAGGRVPQIFGTHAHRLSERVRRFLLLRYAPERFPHRDAPRVQ